MSEKHKMSGVETETSIVTKRTFFRWRCTCGRRGAWTTNGFSASDGHDRHASNQARKERAR